MLKYWLSCKKFTVQINCDGANYIIKTPPIVSKFLGQPLKNLEYWMEKIGGFQKELLENIKKK